MKQYIPFLMVVMAGTAMAVPSGTTPDEEVVEWSDPLEEDIIAIDTLGVAEPRAELTWEELVDSVAVEWGIEPALIHAVVEVEAGPSHQGFWQEGKPLVYFSFDSFNRRAQKRGVNMAKARKEHPEAFAAADRRKYGSRQAAVQTRLDAAMAIDSVAAIEATFWGMFQIGGFNWKKCGATSPQDFVARMSQSDKEQLELFITFLQNTNLLEPMKRKDWHRFCRGYNGPSYARRGYHTKLARAYKKMKNEK